MKLLLLLTIGSMNLFAQEQPVERYISSRMEVRYQKVNSEKGARIFEAILLRLQEGLYNCSEENDNDTHVNKLVETVDKYFKDFYVFVDENNAQPVIKFGRVAYSEHGRFFKTLTVTTDATFNEVLKADYFSEQSTIQRVIKSNLLDPTIVDEYTVHKLHQIECAKVK